MEDTVHPEYGASIHGIDCSSCGTAETRKDSAVDRLSGLYIPKCIQHERGTALSNLPMVDSQKWPEPGDSEHPNIVYTIMKL